MPEPSSPSRHPVIYRSPRAGVRVPPLDLAAFVLDQRPGYARRAALVDGRTGEVLTYGEFRARVSATAERLRARGAGPGGVVGLLSPNQPRWAAAGYGILRSGAAMAPVSPALTEDEIVTCLRLAGARWLVAAAGYADLAGRAARRAGARVIGLDDLTAAGPAGEPGTPPAPSAPAVIAFSSGTTGPPKAVVLTHRNMVAALRQHEFGYPAGLGDVFAAALPFFHIYGLSILLSYGLRHRVTIVTMPRFDPAEYLDLIERHRVTWLHVAPPVVRHLAGPAAAGRDFRAVRRLVCGAAPLEVPLARRAAGRLGIPVTQGYGMTEASPGITWVPDTEAADWPPDSVGVLLPSTQARLVDPATGRDVPGEGELWVRGPQVMSGYLGDPVATATVLADGGWLRTGDLATVDAAGRWRITGRLKELIKYNGYQVAPAELESLLLEHPAVADCAVAGVPHPDAGEWPTAYVVAAAPLDAAGLMEWVAARVAPYKRIRAVTFVAAIPRSAAGKILRRELRDLA